MPIRYWHINTLFTMKKVIEIQNIKRNFQVGDETVHALRGVSFNINEGEFVTIMGTSGSGKSTLLNILGCLDTPTSGEYLLDDIPVRTMSKPQRAVLRNRKIGFVFQSYNLLPKTTAVENVELPLMYNSAVSASERRRRAIESLQAVGLGDRLEHKSNQMSGGQMQRVAIARALVNNPAVILADEATGNLDSRTSFEILVLFQKLHAEGRTIIFVTHNPELSQYSSRNIRLRDGQVIEDTANPKILSAAEENPEERCKAVRQDIDRFVRGAEQSDDITMLCVKRSAMNPEARISLTPDRASLGTAADFLSEKLNEWEISPALAHKAQIAVDEIYSNIVYYSGAREATLTLRKEEGQLTLIFEDDGVPYNPTTAKEPDVTLSAEEREIGGLGIFMVKKLATALDYRRTDGRNLLTVLFGLDRSKEEI